MQKGELMEAARERNKQIYEEYLKGAKKKELAEKYGVSPTRIGMIIRWEEDWIAYSKNEVFQVLMELCDDEQLISKTITVLSRMGAVTKEELLKVERKKLKKTRLCGAVMEELIMKMKEKIEKEE